MINFDATQLRIVKDKVALTTWPQRRYSGVNQLGNLQEQMQIGDHVGLQAGLQKLNRIKKFNQGLK